MLRRYRAFPRVSFHSRVAASGSTGPSNVADNSSATSAVRKRLQVQSLELAALPYLVYLGWNAFALTHGEYDLGGLALHDLVQDERRQFVDQMHVVDTEHHSGAWRRGCHRIDHSAHQLQTIGAARPGP